MELLPDASASQERLDLPILGSATELEKRNLLAFDEMDFNVFSGRDWPASTRAMPRTFVSTSLTDISPTVSKSI